MTNYRIRKIKKDLENGKAYIKGFCSELYQLHGLRYLERCYIVVCLDRNYLVPIADCPSLVIFQPFEDKEKWEW